jgi:hypothetical protein
MFLRNGANYGGAISFRAQSKTMNQPQGARAVVSNISVFENHAKSGGGMEVADSTCLFSRCEVLFSKYPIPCWRFPES